MSDRLRRAIDAIDALHAGDPHTIEGRPAELVYAERMTSALESLAPSASDALRIAVRAQHLCRWKLPRAGFPEGTAGYHRWRTEQSKLHASLAREVVIDAGYDEQFSLRVAGLIRKKDLARDAEAQSLEDAACLVFLEHELEAFMQGKDESALIDILRKTWKKMSEAGHQAALALPLSVPVRELVGRALSTGPKNA